MLQNDMNKAYQTALNLERTVIEDAKKKADKIVSEARLAEKEAISAATEQARKSSEQYEQSERTQISAKYSNMITEHTAMCRTQLIKKRGEIQNAVFDKLKDRLREFTQSDGYGDFAACRLSKLKDIGLSDDIEIFVSAVPADAKAAGECFPNAKISESPDITIGGFILRDNAAGVMYDMTLDSSYNLKKSDFPAISGLKISD